MNHGFIATDAIMVTSGILMVAFSSLVNGSRSAGAVGEETAKAV
jgi:hypothetical protein